MDDQGLRMALTSVEKEALCDALSRMGLLGGGEAAEFAELTGGVSARIVTVTTSSRILCVKQALPKLKVKADWAAPLSRNAAEVAWLRMVAEISPNSVPGVLGEDRASATFAMTYLDPVTHPVWKDQLLDGVVNESVPIQLAKLLLRIHNGTAGIPGMEQAFATDASFLALRLEPYFGATAETHRDLTGALAELSRSTLAQRRAVVHGDVSPKNVLIGPKGPLLLDAECAWYGDPAFDLAFCLNHLLLKCVARPDAADAFLRSFDAMVETYLAGVGWEPVKHFELRAAALLPALLLARIDGKSPVEYLRDEQSRQVIREFAKPRIVNPPASLAAIRTAWQRNRPYAE
jgi:aminoglycoside phosphotransferase (APT) family kinase protein